MLVDFVHCTCELGWILNNLLSIEGNLQYIDIVGVFV